MENNQRWGCYIVPVLFNLYSGTEGMGVTVELAEKLIRRYIRNDKERMITECLLVDDCSLLASTRSGANRTTQEYQYTSGEFGQWFDSEHPKEKAHGYTKDPRGE